MDYFGKLADKPNLGIVCFRMQQPHILEDENCLSSESCHLILVYIYRLKMVVSKQRNAAAIVAGKHDCEGTKGNEKRILVISSDLGLR